MQDRPLAFVALAAAAACLTLLLILGPAPGVLLLLAGFDLAAGREASIPAALAAGLPWPMAALVVTLLEWSILLAAAPLLVLAGEALRRWGPFRRAAAAGEALAAKRPTAGPLLLAGLAVFPFLPIGALSALLAGRVLGVPLYRLVPAILGAQLAVNTAWALAAASVLAFLPSPRLLAALVALGLVAAAALAWWRGRKATSM